MPVFCLTVIGHWYVFSWKESLNADGQQFPPIQYQQNMYPTEHKPDYDIIYDGNLHRDLGQPQKCGGLNRLIGSQFALLITGSPTIQK